jgi:FkbM family methyltransferase
MDETIEMAKYFTKVNIRGIIQAGANTGQEIKFFRKYTTKIILFEPIPVHALNLSRMNLDLMVYNYALGNDDKEGILHIASNQGASSSLLQPVDHIFHYKEITFNEDILVKIRKFFTIAKEESIDVSKYNVLVTDCQGYDLEVIKGFEEHIDVIDLVVCEFINTNLYEGNAGLKEITEYLESKGLNFVGQAPEYLGAGNAFFKRN